MYQSIRQFMSDYPAVMVREMRLEWRIGPTNED